MPFPKSDRVIYGKNPLAEVICQLRFPTILKIEEAVPADFQERIRTEYPLYELQEPSIELPQLPKELSSIVEKVIPKPHFRTGHKFSTSDSNRFVAISSDFVAVADSRYERWETFRAEVQRAKMALEETYKPSFYTRIGLRYRNIISRNSLGLAGKRWQDLLKPHVVAELGDPNIADAIVATQTRSSIRTMEAPGGRVTLIHGLHRPSSTDEQCYVIDADFYLEGKEGLGEPFEVLDKFNRLAGNLFRWAIADRLHRAMDPRPI
ncbi:MAG: TIGR04255 family protein [Chloroflexi bacterium]|nr:TIGR04255 family protein [Chloroflexota bacterium]